MKQISKFDRDIETPSDSALVPPETCDVMGCGQPSQLAFLIADDGRKQRVVNGGMAIERTSGGQLKVRSGWKVEGWIARCADCYQRELYRSGKGAMSDVFGDTPWATMALANERSRRKTGTEGPSFEFSHAKP